MRWLFVVLTFAALGACGDDSGATTSDAMTDSVAADAAIDANPNMPATLMDTGLCVDAACSQISAGIFAYKPRFELWSDTATKRRWIQLPAGTQIDTSDMDFWQFPVGTKLWKEFTRDTTRVETRLVMRIGPGNTKDDWFYGAYVWNAAQDTTTLETFGVIDANGTQHDVPSRLMCRSCHENLVPSRVLGFGAIQLDWDNPNAGELDLAELVAMNLLTAPPTGGGAGGYFPLPGTTYEPPALGYLHANCGHCHNATSQVISYTPMQLRLSVNSLGSLAATPTYMTAVNQTGDALGGRTKIVDPMMPDNSIMMYRFESTNPAEHMPALGSEIMDPTGRTTLRDWITNIP